MQNLEISVILKKFHLTLCIKSWKSFLKKFGSFKKVSPKTKKNEDLKAEVLDKAGNLFNELYYNYKEKYKEEKDLFKKRHE